MIVFFSFFLDKKRNKKIKEKANAPPLFPSQRPETLGCFGHALSHSSFIICTSALFLYTVFTRATMRKVLNIHFLVPSFPQSGTGSAAGAEDRTLIQLNCVYFLG